MHAGLQKCDQLRVLFLSSMMFLCFLDSGWDGGAYHGQGGGVPTLDGVPTLNMEGGYPGQAGLGYSLPFKRQGSRTSTCYAAGGMPLAIAQQDFLVLSSLVSMSLNFRIFQQIKFKEKCSGLSRNTSSMVNTAN